MGETPQRVKDMLDRFAELEAERAPAEPTWRRVGEYMTPTRDFALTREQNEIRAPRLLDPIGILSANRLAAFLFGYQLSPAEPWAAPDLLDRDATSEEALWFEQVEWRMHAHLSGPASPVATALSEAMKDVCTAATTVMYRSRRPGGLPSLQTLALNETYIGEDGDGRLDTVYRKFKLTLRQAEQKWDMSYLSEEERRDKKRLICFLHAVEPRPGGQPGAAGPRKPYTSTVIDLDKRQIIEDDKGYDRMRFTAGRFERLSGSVWGRGPGWDALPATVLCNRMSESMIRAAELAVDPPLFGPAALFGGRLDRRAGAFNPVNINALFGADMRTVVGRLDLGGDVGIGVELLNRQRTEVQACFYLDWLDLGEGPTETATKTLDKRELRMRMLSAFAARFEQEVLNPIVEDFFFAMLEAGMFPPPPASLRGQNITFRYKSPLALAQRGQHVDAIQKTFALAAEAMQFDQSAALVLRADELLRRAARNLGVSERDMRSAPELEEMRQQRAQMAAETHAADTANAAAGALQQGAQGIASLAAVNGAQT